MRPYKQQHCLMMTVSPHSPITASKCQSRMAETPVTQMLISLCDLAARCNHSKAGALRDICVQQADAKSADMAVIAFQVRAIWLL